jgi:alpha-L-fucosidase
VPGVYYIDVPAGVADLRMTVLALELEEPLKLYRGSGRVVSFNE